MEDDFYRSLMEKFRGSREVIKSRLGVYLPFIVPIRDLVESPSGLDLGCGRGEWLELMQENGFDAEGVDMDDAMLSVCRDLGLNVHAEDALKFLGRLAEESRIIISGFHLAEHIPFPDLKKLVHEALRVLKPGGLLILETPNPENLVIGSSNFYIDPTHIRPIPPELLSFLCEYTGFKRVKVLRLQESFDLANDDAPNLMDVFKGVSPDYAVVAQKDGSREVFEAIEPAISMEYGITLTHLSEKYSQKTEGRANVKAQCTAMPGTKASELAQRLSALESRVLEQQSRINELGSMNHHLCVKATEFETERNALSQSWSWRITAPLRWVAGVGITLLNTRRPITNIQAGFLSNFMQNPFTALMGMVLNNPELGYFINQKILRYPTIHSFLRKLAIRRGLMTDTSDSFSNLNRMQITDINPPEFSNLTPRARQIYTDLQTALARRQQETV